MCFEQTIIVLRQVVPAVGKGVVESDDFSVERDGVCRASGVGFLFPIRFLQQNLGFLPPGGLSISFVLSNHLIDEADGSSEIATLAQQFGVE